MTAGHDTGADWDRLWNLFHDALELDATARRKLLDRLDSENHDLRLRLDRLLDAHAQLSDAALPDIGDLLESAGEGLPGGEPSPGDTLGPYEIGERIGAGGMGSVFLARQSDPVQRVVALKFLRFGLASRDILARFNAERQALAIMSHSNIARIFDAGTTEGGQPYFAMEYVPGRPITDYCDACRLDIDDRLRLFLNVCDGVLHAHQKGIIHRDLKPSNILIAEENGVPVPKIIDFGIAKAAKPQAGGGSLYTHIGTLIGTPEYMSPEQAGVVPLDVDIRADVYSLGVLLYEILVGMLPYESTTSAKGLLEVQQAIRDEEPKRPSRRLSSASGEVRSRISDNRAMRPGSLQRRLHSDIEWILLKAIDKNRELRYPSAAEFAADIRRYLSGMPVIARAPTARYRVARFVRRHALGVSIAAGIALLLVLFAGAMTAQSLRLQRSLEQTILERNRAEHVTNLMVELFEGANPEVSGRNDVTVAEMLEEGARYLMNELSSQPELRGRMLATIAESYRALGGDDNATKGIEMLEQAIADLDKLDADPAQKAVVFDTMGAINHDLGNFEEAESWYLRALALVEADPESRILADVLGNLSVLSTDRGDLVEAERYGRASLAVQIRVAGLRDVTTARLKQRLAFVLYQRQQSDEAQELILNTVDIIEENYGSMHPSVATALAYAASIQGGAEDYHGAQQSLLRAIEIYRSAYGPDHPYVATALSNLSIQYNRTADFDDAADSLAEALRIGIASYGADHPNVNSFRVNLGANLQDMGRLVEAEPLLQEGLRYDRETLQSGSPFLLATLDRLGATLDRLGRHEEAEAYLREAADMRREHFGIDNRDTGVAILNLALNRLAEGAAGEANALATESVAIQRVLPDNDDALAQGLAGLGRVRIAEGRNGDARELLREALELFGPATEKTVLHMAMAGRFLGEFELAAGNEEAAIRAFETAEVSLQTQAPDGHPDLIDLRVSLTGLRCGADEASVEYLHAARPLLVRALGDQSKDLARLDATLRQCLAKREVR